jgi:peroxiredoxin
MDTVAEQNAFAAKFQIPFPLLCDLDGRICDSFQVPHPANKPKRETFIFQQGRLVAQDRSVDPAMQAQDVVRMITKVSTGQALGQ